jgi:hypothetical protein
MTDDQETVSGDVAELLNGYTPMPSASPEWREIQRHSRSRSRRLLFVAAVALVVAAPALALSSSVRNLVGLAHPEPVVEEATLLVSAPVGNGFWVHAWTAPSSTGGRCDFMTTDRSRATRSVTEVNGGGACAEGRRGERLTRARPEYPLNVGLSIGRRPKGDAPNWVPPVVSGAVLPSLHAARIEVVWDGGSLRLALRDNYFLGGSPALYMPPFERFPFTVVAYNAAGTKVAEERLNSPSLLLMNGWKEYTPAYKKWRRSRG